MRKSDWRMAYSRLIRAGSPDLPHDASFMTFFSTAQHIARGSRGRSRAPHDPDRGWDARSPPARWRWSPICCGRPGEPDASSGPARLPVSVGATLFNVPTKAIRMKIQRHSGPQERVDLSFIFPSLEPPDAPKHVSADAVEETMQPIDRIFLSIAAHHDTLAPDTRVRTIYPRYLEQASTPGQDGLTMRAFRDGTPYSNEDLFLAPARRTSSPAAPAMPRRRECA